MPVAKYYFCNFLFMINNKILAICIVLSIFSINISAQSYSSLWKQVDKASQKDKPKDALKILSIIGEKAQRENAYGQLLKSQINTILQMSAISSDSLLPQIKHYEYLASKADNVILSAVYSSTLGHIYKNYPHIFDINEDSAMVIAKKYYAQSLRYPDKLSTVKAGTYEPLIEDGENSIVFNDDLFHVLAMEAEDYNLMRQYYQSVGNRHATCISALYQLQQCKNDAVRICKKSKYLATIDSLIHEYKDLPEAGELAIEHFNYIDGSTDASAQEKIEYIDNALVNWPTWPRMVVLKNARDRMTLPSFHATIPETLTIPNKVLPVYITSITNIQRLKINVYKVEITGDESFYPNDENDYALLRSKLSSKPVFTDERVYYGLPEYKEVRDTLQISPLPVGVYMVEFITDNKDIAVERTMLNITNLRLIDMDLPDNKKRLVVVDATSGKPISGAKVYMKFREWKEKEWQEDKQELTTESDGEVIFSSTLSPYNYRITNDNDKAFPWLYISHYRGNISNVNVNNKEMSVAQIFSDRVIYRPGQTAQMSVVVYNVLSRENWQVASNKKVNLVLKNAKYETVTEKTIITDEWGVASADFELPKDGVTGYHSIQVMNVDAILGSTHFIVEEYKRPTFEVKIDDYNTAYKEGDTITVKGWAKTYSGIPVQNAKVSYKVNTQFMFWWARTSKNDKNEVFSAETTTDEDGSFLVTVPIQMPTNDKSENRFAKVVLTANVTTNAGETHYANSSYPLSDKATAFFLDDFDDKQCRENQLPFKYTYLNNSGKKIDATLKYSIDGGLPISVKANSEVLLNISDITSGRHQLQAICEKDTIKHDFIVFSLKDTKAPVDTVAWYYSTTGENSQYSMKNGKTEYIQFGTSTQDQTIFYSVVTNTSVLESGRITISDNLNVRPISYKDEWGDGIAIRYSWVKDGMLYSYEQRYSCPEKENKLNVEWSTFRDRLTPGQKEEWTMSVKNEDGTPAKAHVMAVLFDKSLDTFEKHEWLLDHKVYYRTPSIPQTASYDTSSTDLYGEQYFRPISENGLVFSHFSIPYIFTNMIIDGPIVVSGIGIQKKQPLTGSLSGRAAGVKVMADSRSSMNTVDKSIVKKEKFSQDGIVQIDDMNDISNVPMRDNLNETAFFMPQLVTDKNGKVDIKFTLPESLTTWKFMSLSHDKNMNIGSLSSEVIAQKKLMIQPNIPRFIREGDKAQMSATIMNNSEKNISGKAYLIIMNPRDEKVLSKLESKFQISQGKQSTVMFNLPENLVADVYVCKVVAQTSNFSDGEQQLLPVLSNNIEVTTTRAFTQTKSGEKRIDLNSIYGKNASKESLKVEYTNNPAWLMIDALPVVSKPDVDNAISLATALYANSISETIKSELNIDTLKAVTQISSNEIIGRLANLQNHDGSFSWFTGMQPSRFVTQAVTKLLARMKHQALTGNSINFMLKNAMSYLDKEMDNYTIELKKFEKEFNTKPTPSDLAIDYLYIQTLIGEKLDGKAINNSKYLFSLLDEISPKLTIYGKANLAIVYAKHPEKTDKKRANELLESVRQYSVSTEEMGRYFDTYKALYSWFDYKIPTQTAAIEALEILNPDDKQTIADMQLWLLQEKRTQQWDTPLNSASAIYAFFNGWNKTKTNSVSDSTRPVEATRLYVDNVQVAEGEITSGKGYFSKTIDGRHSLFTADKKSDNISWGAIYATFTQPLEDINEESESISILREIFDENGRKPSNALNIGQKVKVRITLTASRDLDFVEITDNRAACLEPVYQTSGYRRGYYISPLDNKTVYYFDNLSKGKHVIETEYYVDRAGNYKSGIATAKCIYAPEFQARDTILNVETK